jgi:dolichol-phosphate mannosyltransferase
MPIGSSSGQPLPHLAVVIPVYQAEDSLEPVVAELRAALEAVTSDFDVVLVDDGSTDRSWAVIDRLCAQDRRVRGYRLIRNFGEHVAITAGIDRVDADHVVIMACDGQDDPAAIRRMLEAAHGGADLVLVRRMKRRDGWLKRLLARLFYALISLLFHVHYDYRVGNYRLLTRRAVEYFRQHRERGRNVNAIMALMGLRTAYVDVTHRPRTRGRSTYTLGRSARMAAGVVVGYSQIPLLVSGLLGALLVFGAIAWAGVLGVRALTGATASPTSIIVCAVMGVGGLLLLNLGIVGAYLGRAATEAEDRPMYYVSETTTRDPAGEKVTETGSLPSPTRST